MDLHRIAAVSAVLTVAFLAISGTASAQWTPTKPGDPRVCAQFKPADCASLAASIAFKEKYKRVTGHPFGNTLDCSPQANLLNWTCVWGAAQSQTVVRFAHRAAGWKVAVGVITP